MPHVLWLAVGFAAGAIVSGVIQEFTGWGIAVAVRGLAHKFGYGRIPVLKVGLSSPLNQAAAPDEWTHLQVENIGLPHARTSDNARNVRCEMTTTDGSRLPMVWQVPGKLRGSEVVDIARACAVKVPLTFRTPDPTRSPLGTYCKADQHYLSDSRFISDGEADHPLSATTHQYRFRAWADDQSLSCEATVEIEIRPDSPTIVRVSG